MLAGIQQHSIRAWDSRLLLSGSHLSCRQPCTRIESILLTKMLMQVQEAQEKVHSLELANYSLAMHLRQANSSASGMHHSHDVF